MGGKTVRSIEELSIVTGIVRFISWIVLNAGNLTLEILFLS